MGKRPSKKRDKLECAIPKVTVHASVKDEKELKIAARAQREKISWAKVLLDVPKVWRVTQGKGVKVAVLDTGVDPDHPDLEKAIVGHKDFTGDGIEDKNGHGTHCAGIIAARLNGVGFVGVAPKADLLIGKVLNNKGSGRFAWIASGIDWAVSQGADIISMSLGGPGSTNTLFKSIHAALQKGVFVMCAAGNEGSLAQNAIGYPGRYGGVITVASHDSNGNRSGFSSSGGELDFMAPGSEIWSTYKNGGYATLSGTSMATPFVAGLAALITARHKNNTSRKTPLENNEDLKEHLMRMAAHPGYHENKTGYGPLLPFQYFAA